ncbi:hypothetical protein EB796_023976 [Bugula neritina]|uniref:Uncharacterized protein n=1 Tax=Bugula neritina TaxID=10212 RepID=A0A7J7IWA1_BUGNE|nr:hypothetical protein EB796_023976 [Bugula neritina]
MVLLKSCCCWWQYPDSIKKGSYASCVYSTVVGAVQLIMAGWAIYKMIMIRYAPNLDDRWNDNEIVYWFPPGSDAFLYISFLFVIVKLIVGILLWSGIQRGNYLESKNYILAWVVLNAIFELYIVTVVIYICGYLQYYRLYDLYFMHRELVVGVWWAIIDTFVMFWAIICVLSFYQQLEEHEFGKARKTKRAVWNFDLGLSYRTGSITTYSRPPSTAYSFESLADRQRSVSTTDFRDYGVNASSV